MRANHELAVFGLASGRAIGLQQHGLPSPAGEGGQMLRGHREEMVGWISSA